MLKVVVKNRVICDLLALSLVLLVVVRGFATNKNYNVVMPEAGNKSRVCKDGKIDSPL